VSPEGPRGDASWETHAAWWQANFTAGADPEYEEQILPIAAVQLAGARRVLDVGCGEGQLARVAAAGGAEAVGVDPTANQLRTARVRGGGVRYARARAERLPFPADAFDAVVICLTLEHLEPFEPAVEEVSRVLAPGGRFVLFLNHPLLQAPESGWVDDQILGEQYWRLGAYLSDDVVTDEIAPGVNLPFMHRPLGRYINVMADCGLLVERMEEPPPPPGFLAEAPEYDAAATIPRLLVLRARRQA
jgi:SAM-dependent methyltransferase